MVVDAHVFVELARPMLASGDAAELARVIGYRWTAFEIADLLRHPQADVRRLAAVTVGMIGDRTAACRLATALRDEDEQVARMAEHGLWVLWFRGGSAAAQEPFQQGLTCLNQGKAPEAIGYFDRAAEIDPTFAEPFHQCALAHETLEQWRQALEDCCRAIRRMPCHFGALACMGHCYAQMGDLRRAMLCYRRTIVVHPRCSGIRAALDRLERSFADANDHSGRYDAQSI